MHFGSFQLIHTPFARNLTLWKARLGKRYPAIASEHLLKPLYIKGDRQNGVQILGNVNSIMPLLGISQ